MVLAGSPRRMRTQDDDPTLALDWEDAIAALSTAVVERRGALIAPANVGLVNLLAQAAMPHAQAHRIMTPRERAPVEAVETGGTSISSRRLLASFAHRNALAYRSQDGRPVPLAEMPLPTEEDARLLTDAPHHPFAHGLLEGALGGVVVHPDPEMSPELFELREQAPTRLAVFGGRDLVPDLSGWAQEHDPTRDLLEGLADPDELSDTMPYGLVMELLLDRWLQSTQ